MATIESKYRDLSSQLDEATLRVWAATEARCLGHGGISLVAKAIGLSRTTIHAGLSELKAATPPIDGRCKRGRVLAAGGGRKKLTDKTPCLHSDIDALLEPMTRGDPMSPLRWTCKSTRRLAEELKQRGHQVSQRTICDLLHQAGYSLQSTRKTEKTGSIQIETFNFFRSSIWLPSFRGRETQSFRSMPRKRS